MASKNQVTLTFAGDSSDLEKAFDKVGQSSKQMGSDVDKASVKVRDSGAGFDKAGEAADNLDTKAMGFRDTMTGVQDTMLGTSQIAKGNLFEGFLTLGMGVGDLGSGLFNFLIPAVKSASLSMVGNAVSTTRATIATGRHKVAMLGSAVATRVMTVAQRGLNLAMRANPLGLIITALFLVGTALVVAYKKSSTFRAIVQGAMRGVQRAFGWVLDRGKTLLSWFRSAPGKIGGAFSRLGGIISAPFRAAFGQIKSLWNSTAGGFGFSIPGWVPKIGGNSFRIPRMHTGGVMGGAPGTEGLALLQAGERVTPAGASGDRTVIEIRSDGTRLGDLLVEVLSRSIRVRGGNVQAVLGG